MTNDAYDVHKKYPIGTLVKLGFRDDDVYVSAGTRGVVTGYHTTDDDGEYVAVKFALYEDEQGSIDCDQIVSPEVLKKVR